MIFIYELNPQHLWSALTTILFKMTRRLFTFYLSQIQIAADYATFLESLNLGLGVKNQISTLRMYATEALVKIRRFESPGIYVLIVDDQTLKISSLQLFDEATFFSVNQFKTLLAVVPQNSNVEKVKIRNYSIVSNRATLQKFENELANAKRIEIKKETCANAFSVLRLQVNYWYLCSEGNNVTNGNAFLAACSGDGTYFKRISSAAENEDDMRTQYKKLIDNNCVIVNIYGPIFDSICKSRTWP